MPLNDTQRANVVTLIGILSGITDAQYDHRFMWDDDGKHGMCASGWTCANKDKFVVEGNPSRGFENAAFGEDIWEAAFEYNVYGHRVSEVTRQQVMARLQRIADTGEYFTAIA